MQKVNSFIVDHTVLQPGIYVTEVNGVFTYDIRFVAPRDAVGKGLFMTPQSAHTFEHFMADYMRTKISEEFSKTVLYVGPMGCLTGFYLLTSVKYDELFIKQLVIECMEHILSAEDGEIPGASELTCGNYKYFDLPKTKQYINEIIIPNFNSDRFSTLYPMIEESSAN